MSSNILQFEVKFYCHDIEISFPATKTFKDMIKHIEEFYHPNVTLQYTKEGFNVLSSGDHVGTIKPTYLTDSKVNWLHQLFNKNIH